ncbi:HNH endonuclease [Falsiroseomonas sp. CW058]|uniref:HNH endonuclease n=1 Tax=Falsiroseomonas sp. CW058 TaxID=3388664 RepID=UPI003D31781B
MSRRLFISRSQVKLRFGGRAPAAPLRDAAGGRGTFGRISSYTRRVVWERDGGACVRCGADEDLHFDHIVPVALGGSGSPANVELLCRGCNLKKGAKLAAGG